MFNHFYSRLPVDFGSKLESEIKTSLKRHIPSEYYIENNRILEKRINNHCQVDLKQFGYY
jgi:hypothetical protein